MPRVLSLHRGDGVSIKVSGHAQLAAGSRFVLGHGPPFPGPVCLRPAESPRMWPNSMGLQMSPEALLSCLGAPRKLTW